jgi:hypothetical protein
LIGRASNACEPGEPFLLGKKKPLQRLASGGGVYPLTGMFRSELEPSAQSNSRTSLTRSCMDGFALPKNIMVLSM